MTLSNAFGSATRSLGSACSKVYDKTLDIQEEYELVQKAKSAIDTTLTAADNLDQNYQITGKIDEKLKLSAAVDRARASVDDFRATASSKVEDFKSKAEDFKSKATGRGARRSEFLADSAGYPSRPSSPPSPRGAFRAATPSMETEARVEEKAEVGSEDRSAIAAPLGAASAGEDAQDKAEEKAEDEEDPQEADKNQDAELAELAEQKAEDEEDPQEVDKNQDAELAELETIEAQAKRARVSMKAEEASKMKLKGAGEPKAKKHKKWIDKFKGK